jgi:hypothetical protein
MSNSKLLTASNERHDKWGSERCVKWRGSQVCSKKRRQNSFLKTQRPTMLPSLAVRPCPCSIGSYQPNSVYRATRAARLDAVRIRRCRREVARTYCKAAKEGSSVNAAIVARRESKKKKTRTCGPGTSLAKLVWSSGFSGPR